MESRYNSYDDKELGNLIHQGDVLAYTETYNRYVKRLLDQALYLLGDKDKAEDIVHDIFETLWKKRSDLRVEHVGNFLFQGMKHLSIDAFRKDKNRKIYLSSLKDYLNNSESRTDHKVRESEMRERIEREVNNLSPRARQMWEMSRNAYMSYQQIAEATGTSQETVRRTISKTLNILRHRLASTMLLQVMSAILWLNRTL